jgi:ABC-2 type transport system permease protein
MSLTPKETVALGSPPAVPETMPPEAFPTPHPDARAPTPEDLRPQPSLWRAWCYLVVLSWQRQARARQMVWIAVGLLAFSTALVAINTAAGRWGLHNRGFPGRNGPTYEQWIDRGEISSLLAHRSAGGQAVTSALFGSARMLLNESAFLVFSRWLVFSVFLSFLLPVWSLSFATEAIGGDREHNSLVWLLTRPIPRPAIYLAKFVALLPWSLGLNVGGFAILCLAGGQPGALALRLFWPAVFWATLAFTALFYLTGAFFRRPAVVAIVYSFFLETLLGNMPGYLKRVSIGFYARCMMFEAAQEYGVQPEKPSVFLPVDGTTATAVLIGLTVGLLVLGAVLFSRSQYHEVV